MRIAIGNDHAAVPEKRALRDRLRAAGHEVIDVGTDSTESTDYPIYAAEVGRLVTSGAAERGVLICGTGIGVCMAANKVRGVRAALCHSTETARLAREHNDANVLCLGARVTERDVLLASLDAFMTTEFAGGRHARRVARVMDLEDDGD